MLAGVLKEMLEGVPDDAIIYLDDNSMPTPMGLVSVDFSEMPGYSFDRNEEGKIVKDSAVKIKVNVVTLATYELS